MTDHLTRHDAEDDRDLTGREDDREAYTGDRTAEVPGQDRAARDIADTRWPPMTKQDLRHADAGSAVDDNSLGFPALASLELAPRPRLEKMTMMLEKLCVPMLRGNHDELTFGQVRSNTLCLGTHQLRLPLRSGRNCRRSAGTEAIIAGV